MNESVPFEGLLIYSTLLLKKKVIPFLSSDLHVRPSPSNISDYEGLIPARLDFAWVTLPNKRSTKHLLSLVKTWDTGVVLCHESKEVREVCTSTWACLLVSGRIMSCTWSWWGPWMSLLWVLPAVRAKQVSMAEEYCQNTKWQYFQIYSFARKAYTIVTAFKYHWCWLHSKTIALQPAGYKKPYLWLTLKAGNSFLIQTFNNVLIPILF